MLARSVSLGAASIDTLCRLNLQVDLPRKQRPSLLVGVPLAFLSFWTLGRSVRGFPFGDLIDHLCEHAAGVPSRCVAC